MMMYWIASPDAELVNMAQACFARVCGSDSTSGKYEVRVWFPNDPKFVVAYRHLLRENCLQFLRDLFVNMRRLQDVPPAPVLDRALDHKPDSKPESKKE